MFPIRNAAFGLAAIAATGCALPGPQISYSATETPHSQTAVIMKDPRADGVLVTITEVNGNKTACFSQGCPIWVRVLPGPAKISIDLDIADGTWIYHGKYDLEVVAEPLHTYLIKYAVIDVRMDKKAATTIVDAGIGYSDGFNVRGSIVRPTF
jgi:hypothetical protein